MGREEERFRSVHLEGRHEDRHLEAWGPVREVFGSLDNRSKPFRERQVQTGPTALSHCDVKSL